MRFQMKQTMFCVGVQVLLYIPAAVAAVEDKAARIEAGKKALNTLKALVPGSTETSYFEVVAKYSPDREVVGYLSTTLEGTRGEGGAYYLYTLEMFATQSSAASRFIDGRLARPAMFWKCSSTLRSDFQPIVLDVTGIYFDVQGKKQTQVARIVIGSEKVTTSSKAGWWKKSHEGPRPEEPFVYGIPALIPRLDFRADERIILELREFDTNSGSAKTMTLEAYASHLSDDGPLYTNVFTTKGQPDYDFWLDQSGKLVEWGWMGRWFRRTSQERAEEIRAKMYAEWKLDAPEPSLLPKSVLVIAVVALLGTAGFVIARRRRARA